MATPLEATPDDLDRVHRMRAALGLGLDALLSGGGGAAAPTQAADADLAGFNTVQEPEQAPPASTSEQDGAPNRRKAWRQAAARRIGAGLHMAGQLAVEGIDMAANAAADGFEAATTRYAEAADRRQAEREWLEEVDRRHRAEPKHIKQLRRRIDKDMRLLNSGVVRQSGAIEQRVQGDIRKMWSLGYDYYDFLSPEEPEG